MAKGRGVGMKKDDLIEGCPHQESLIHVVYWLSAVKADLDGLVQGDLDGDAVEQAAYSALGNLQKADDIVTKILTGE